MATIGFVGLGQMGRPMSRNLLKAGHGVAVFDIDRTAVEAMARDSARTAESPADAAEGADFVITMLPTGPIVSEAVFGNGGIAESLAPEALYIDSSTILPQETTAIGARLVEQGKRMIDAPVGRTSAHAESGSLVFMVGGEEDDIARARPLLEVMGEVIIPCGPLGAAATVKLINNYISAVCNLATAEGFAMAEAAGVAPAALVEVLGYTPAGRGHLHTTWPEKALKDDPTPAFKLNLAHKDMGLALAMAAQLRVPAVTGAAGREVYAMARAQGRGEDDWITGILRTVKALSAPDR